MRILLACAVLLLTVGCGEGGLFALDCGAYSPAPGSVLVLGAPNSAGYAAYEDVVSWDTVDHTFTIGGETFTEEVLHSSSTADVEYGDGGVTHWEQESWLRCDQEGVWLVGQTYVSSTVYGDGQQYEVDQHTEFNSPSFIRPLEPELDDVWQRSFDYTVVSADPDIEPTPVDVIWTETVISSDDITTPAGIFPALETSTETTESEFKGWIGEGVGFLQNDNVWLVEVR